jgi:glycosyltransferase involved in cell wall biosynthesis
MKVLHLVTDTRGGAGMAASRLHIAMLNSGIESILISRNQSYLPNSQVCRNLFSKFLLSKVVTLLLKIVTKRPYSLVTPFSLNLVTFAQIQKINPDVIHIHNWFNLISNKNILSITEKYKTVFTLHDSRLYTGGCHYSHSCTRYLETCERCPAVYAGKKLIQLAKYHGNQLSKEKIDLIFPSNWLAHDYRKAIPGSKNNVNVISNLIPQGESIFDERFLSNQTWSITFISAHLQNPAKGLDLLFRAIQKSEFNLPGNKLNLVGSGQGNVTVPNGLQVKVEFFGFLKPTEVSKILASTHILAIPSITDNFPNVVGEGQRAGCIVLGTNIGGIPEIIEDGVNGFICEAEDQNFSDKINSILRHVDLASISMQARESFTRKFDEDSIVEKHLEIYNA